jgi:hypothetical protein
LKVTLILMKSRKRETEYTIYSDRFKREVDEAHRLFFEKRGIDPNKMDGDFLFGSKSFRKFRANNPSWSPHSNAQPTSQYPPEMNHNY